MISSDQAKSSVATSHSFYLLTNDNFRELDDLSLKFVTLIFYYSHNS